MGLTDYFPGAERNRRRGSHYLWRCIVAWQHNGQLRLRGLIMSEFLAPPRVFVRVRRDSFTAWPLKANNQSKIGCDFTSIRRG